jgi:hypothetical protein
VHVRIGGLGSQLPVPARAQPPDYAAFPLHRRFDVFVVLRIRYHVKNRLSGGSALSRIDKESSMSVLARMLDYSAHPGVSDMRLSPADLRALVHSVIVPFRVTTALGLEDCH